MTIIFTQRAQPQITILLRLSRCVTQTDLHRPKASSSYAFTHIYKHLNVFRCDNRSLLWSPDSLDSPSFRYRRDYICYKNWPSLLFDFLYLFISSSFVEWSIFICPENSGGHNANISFTCLISNSCICYLVCNSTILNTCGRPED